MEPEIPPQRFPISGQAHRAALEPTSNQPSDEQLLGQFIPLHYHFNMLQDDDRVSAFQQAIAATVTPGAKVVELGGGTGILSYFAAQQGADVVCVERNPELVDAARRFLADNAVEDHVTVVQADAFEFVPDHPVDVVVCEMLHTAMLREKQLEVIHAFKKRYIARWGGPLPTFVPMASRLFVQPVEQSFDFFGYQAPIPMFQPAAAEHPRTKSLADPIVYETVLYDEQIPLRLAWDGLIRVEHAGQLNALRFLTQNILSIDVEQQISVPWSNQFLVLPVEPVTAIAGQSLRIQFDYSAGQSLAALQTSIRCEIVEPVSRRKAA